MTAKLIQVIQTTHTVGRGTPEDPHRQVTHYFSTDGKWLGAEGTATDESVLCHSCAGAGKVESAFKGDTLVTCQTCKGSGRERPQDLGEQLAAYSQRNPNWPIT
jgi:DnaJ-class molecular chaperone